MSAKTDRMRALLHELVDLACNVIEQREPKPTDDLVHVALGPISALGLELRPVQALIADGRLKTIVIGRRRFTKKSLLLALVDELPHAARAACGPAPKRDDALAKAVERAATRRAGGVVAASSRERR